MNVADVVSSVIVVCFAQILSRSIGACQSGSTVLHVSCMLEYEEHL